MSIQKRLIYMGLGGFLALSLFIGAFAAFAQSGEGEATDPEVQSEEGTTTEEGSVPTPFQDRQFGPRGFAGSGDNEFLADALGISVEDLQTAYETAAAAAIQQALDEGLLTEEQAEALSAGSRGFHGGMGFAHGAGTIDFEALLADALGISVEELQAARLEAHAAKLAELVEAGAITQEDADLMLARQTVQSYIDQEAINEAIQSAYETAVDQALADGVITEAQAEQMLENAPGFGAGGFGFGVPGGPGGRGHNPGQGGRQFHGGPQGGFFAPPAGGPAINGTAAGA